MAKAVEFKSARCSDDKELDEYLDKSYLECFALMENICEAINERFWIIFDYFEDMAKDGTTNSDDMLDFVFGELREYAERAQKYAKDVYIFGVSEYQEKGCLNWIDILYKRVEGKDYTEAIGLSLVDFKEKYLSNLDVKLQLKRLPSYIYNIDGVDYELKVLEDLCDFCHSYIVYFFNDALKHIRVNVDRLLSGKEVGFEDWQYSFDFAGTKLKIVNGANNIFQSLFSKRKVFINEDLYKKIEDDVIKTHKKADDIVNEIISNYYNGIKTENPATVEEQLAPTAEDDMAQIDAMLKSMNGEEVEAPVAEPTVEEKPADELEVDQVVEEKSQVSQEVVETLNSAKSSLADSLDEEFRKLQESLGF